MNKKEFLKVLEKELISLNVIDITGILEYYDELIEDQIESGLKEKEVIDKFSIYDIIKEVKAHKKINEAVDKPTISNGIKALIAFLGILSFPMLIAFGAIIFAIFIAICAIIFALVVTVGALFISGIASAIAFFAAMIMGELPLSTSLFSIGVSFILIGIFSTLIKWTINVSKDMILWTINLIKAKFYRMKGGKTHE